MTSASARPAHKKGLSVSDLRAVREGRTVIEDLRFHVEPGAFVGLFGPPGCGKSMLLRLLAGLEIPAFGRIAWDGRPVAGQDLDRGLVLCDSGLFPWLSLRDNLLLACEAARPDSPPGHGRALAEDYLALAGLGDDLDRRPLELTRGGRLRASLVRALALGSPVLFLDDPFCLLEPRERTALEDLLPRLVAGASPRRTVVMATEDLDEALYLADRVIGLPPAAGPAVYDEPLPVPRPRSRDDLYAARAFQDLRRLLRDSYRQERRRRLAAREFFGFGEGI